MTTGDADWSWRWVMVSLDLLAAMGEWSEPLQMRVISDADDVLLLELRKPEPESDEQPLA